MTIEQLRTKLKPVVAAVMVAAPARLHFGFVDLNGGLGRRFGGLGATLEAPQTRITVRPAPEFSAVGPSAPRALEFARTLRDKLDLPLAVAIEVHEAIPEHAGLGSGTQLALAVGSGIARLFGVTLPAADIAQVFGRGARSGVGIGAFEHGGFLLDGGRDGQSRCPPVTSRLAIPGRWRLLLALDSKRQGVHGEHERRAFAELPAFPAERAAELCRVVLMQALPALAEADVNRFGAAISEIQGSVGDHFAPLQGGRFASPVVAEAIAWLERNGAAGAGQSSWGPTGFAVCETESIAKALKHGAETRWPPASGLRFIVCKPRNQGGVVRAESADELARNPSRVGIDRA